MKCALICLVLLLMSRIAMASPLIMNGDFESPTLVGWTTAGDVAVSTEGAFQGEWSLLLSRKGDHLVPTQAVSDAVEIQPGAYTITCAMRTDLYAQDMSFNGAVSIEFHDADGKSLQVMNVAVAQGKTAWKRFEKTVMAPAGSTTARLTVQFNKTHGRIWLDAVTLAPSAAATPTVRVTFSTRYMGNFFYPDDRAIVRMDVTSPVQLEQTRVTWDVRDYWGARVAAARESTLARAGDADDNGGWRYHALLDAADLPLKVGPYYEVHARFEVDGRTVEESSSFAILPESSAYQVDPRKLPFGTHSWDDRQYSYFALSARLGLRNAAIFWHWPHEAPHTPDFKPGTFDHDGRIAWPRKFGLRTFTQLYPAMDRERGDTRHSDESLREGMRQTIERHTKDGMWAHQIGNEPPHWDHEQLKRDVEVYKILYETIKETDPSHVVIGSAIGPNEDFFKLGFQNYCDVYNIHAYSDLGELRRGMKKYQELFARYGGKKPIWSTEIGSMSQGLTRHQIAMDIVRKASCFFADGGEFFCWFAITYPDPKGTRRGSYGDSMDLFAGYLEQYNPRLDAVAYFHYIDQMGQKRFVEEVTYPNGATGVLFRDDQNHCLQVLWNLAGSAADVTIPLPEVDGVRLTQIDGTGARLETRSGGVTLRVGAEPVLLSYRQQSPQPLAKAFAPPTLEVRDQSLRLYQGVTSELEVLLADHPNDRVVLIGPPVWTITQMRDQLDGDGRRNVRFSIDVPADTPARAARLAVQRVDERGVVRSHVLITPEVQSRISTELLPLPTTKNGEAGIELVIRNNGDELQTVRWAVELLGASGIAGGEFKLTELQPAGAYFGDVAEGERRIEPKQEARVRLKLQDVERQTLYSVQSRVVDAGGKAVVRQRYMGGFVGVPQATIAPDGALDEPAWSKSPVLRIDEARQWFTYQKTSQWNGPDDLSATARFLWDEHYLYVGVVTTDDVFHATQSDNMIWSMDGLQMLFDPHRDKSEKLGRYEYSFGIGTKGPQAWCALSADGRAPTGEAKQIIVTGKRHDASAGGMVYEIAIPWTRLAPFEPAVGRNLGAALIVNEDDGKGRTTFLGWFSGVHNKTVNSVGDLILCGPE